MFSRSIHAVAKAKIFFLFFFFLQLSSIPLCKCPKVVSSTHLLMDTWAASIPWRSRSFVMELPQYLKVTFQMVPQTRFPLPLPKQCHQNSNLTPHNYSLDSLNGPLDPQFGLSQGQWSLLYVNYT